VVITFSQRLLLLLCITGVALPWLWALDVGPLPGMLNDLLAWTVVALLVSLLPLFRGRRTELVAWGWLIAAVANVFIALLQYVDLEDAFYPWVANTVAGYGYGNVRHLNILASLLNVGLLSLIWLLKENRLRAWHAGSLGLALIVGQSMASSRVGMAQLLVIALLLAYWRPWPVKSMLPWMLAAGITLFAAGGLLPLGLSSLLGVDAQRQLLQRFTLNDGCYSRWLIWSNVWELILLKPWTGWGWDGLLYAHYVHLFEGARSCMKLSNAHNLYLQWAVEYGLPFAALAVLGTVGLIWRFKPWAATSPSEQLGWGVLALLGLHSLVEFPLWYGHGQMMAGLALMMAIGPRLAQTPASAQALVLRLRAMLSVAVLAVLGLIALDYHRVSQIYLPEQWRSRFYSGDTFHESQRTVLFKSHALIAQVVRLPITADNAQLMLQAAEQSLRIAPDSRIIRRILEAAQFLGREDLVAFHTTRYKAAWPKEYEEWLALSKRP
jgi:O-antigen polymerase